MNQYKPYPSYKPSGIEWLGEIPAHWDVRRLKFVACINPSKSEVSHLPDDLEVSFLPMERVRKGALDLELKKPIKEVKQGFTYFRDGDILVAKITPSFENGKGALAFGLEDGIGFGTTELHVIRATPKVNRRFLYYLTFSHQFRGMGETQMYGTAGQKRVPDSFVNDFPTPLPPLPEQRAIAAYLDRETGHIDALIAKKRELIDLLQRQRTAIISHAVTKGLNPTAPMKDSGIEWLGEIPAHWDVRRLKFVASITYSNVDKHTKEGEIPVRLCNYVDVYNNEYISDTISFMEATARPDEIGRFALRKGDILITKDSEDWKDIAVPAFVTKRLENVICGYHLALIRAYPEIMDGAYLFRGFRASAINYQFQVAASGITRYGLGKQALADALLVVPPLSEQRAIAAYLDRETAHLDALVREIEASIELLQRQRIALISAAVTGKIDVCEQGV